MGTDLRQCKRMMSFIVLPNSDTRPLAPLPRIPPSHITLISATTSHFPILLMQSARLGSDKYQFDTSHWFDSTFGNQKLEAGQESICSKPLGWFHWKLNSQISATGNLRSNFYWFGHHVLGRKTPLKGTQTQFGRAAAACSRSVYPPPWRLWPTTGARSNSLTWALGSDWSEWSHVVLVVR